MSPVHARRSPATALRAGWGPLLLALSAAPGEQDQAPPLSMEQSICQHVPGWSTQCCRRRLGPRRVALHIPLPMEISSTTPSWSNTPGTTGTTSLCQLHPEPLAMTPVREAKTTGTGWPACTHKLFTKCLHSLAMQPPQGWSRGGGGHDEQTHRPGALEWRHRVQVRLHHHQGDVVQRGDALGEPPRVTAHAGTGRGAPHGCKNIALLQ